jgi:uncharacterized protein (DUF2141 family)
MQASFLFSPISLLAGLALCASSQAFAADLTVNISGIRAPEGQVMLALYGGAADFPKPGAQLQARIAQATQGALSFVFRDLPAGRYALVAFHDANGNGKLDRNLVGLPTEAFGFSNGAMGVASSPSFDKAAVDLGADTAIAISLR